MTIDYKTAKHICNVIRRQVQNCFPDLYIDFILHKESKREKAFLSYIPTIKKHPAGRYMITYIRDDNDKILKENQSSFFAISHYNKHGFLGFLKKSNYLALCFLNYEQFTNKDDLRNHALHMAWYAINLYKMSIRDGMKGQILSHSFHDEQKYHNNLKADIFSASLQMLQGKTNILETLSKQRINGTITPKTGFIAENFPFPICLDTLNFVFESNIEQYKGRKKPLISALNIAEDIGKTYKITEIEQWRSFSLPAQEMAWLGYSPEEILGTAIYTSENIYVQSIADMILEHLDIKPKVITSLHDYNPFANPKTNERFHKKQCEELITALLNKITSKKDYEILIYTAKKQNQALLTKSVMGWCANGLISVANTLKEDSNDNFTTDLYDKAKKSFDEAVNSIAWDTLTYFSKKKFQYQRNGSLKEMLGLISLAKSNDEFFSIYEALSFTENIEITNIEPEKPSKNNITSFISGNAIKNLCTAQNSHVKT